MIYSRILVPKQSYSRYSRILVPKLCLGMPSSTLRVEPFSFPSRFKFSRSHLYHHWKSSEYAIAQPIWQNFT
ncbi:MAG: hypothetical protein KAI83_07165 [Thiomargarita sp.]|nr:hypothetical protein [Thiomargarita sp.]